MRFITALLALSIVGVTGAHAEMTVVSKDLTPGKPMDNAQVFNGFGCEGANVSPHLAWSAAPAGTKSFAIMAYDPDAPTGSGWWHEGNRGQTTVSRSWRASDEWRADVMTRRSKDLGQLRPPIHRAIA